MLRQGRGEPLVLLHGVTCSERIWQRVMPLLAPHCDAIALTALGHAGGTLAKPGTTLTDIVDDMEAALDRLGLERPHLAGNSMGGWVAIELARRGRASSVCALSPAGCWQAAASHQRHATNTLKNLVKITQATRWALPVAAKVGLIRRIAMRDNVAHGQRLTPAEMLYMADDLLACSAKYDLLNTKEELAPLDPLPCPIMLAWSERDRIFPPKTNGAYARTLMPGAEWRVLPDVGHLPMLDNPHLVVETILASMRRA